MIDKDIAAKFDASEAIKRTMGEDIDMFAEILPLQPPHCGAKTRPKVLESREKIIEKVKHSLWGRGSREYTKAGLEAQAYSRLTRSKNGSMLKLLPTS